MVNVKVTLWNGMVEWNVEWTCVNVKVTLWNGMVEWNVEWTVNVRRTAINHVTDRLLRSTPILQLGLLPHCKEFMRKSLLT